MSFLEKNITRLSTTTTIIATRLSSIPITTYVAVLSPPALQQKLTHYNRIGIWACR